MFAEILAATSTAVGITAVLGSLASAEVKGAWYGALAKPVIQPPAGAFPIVWTALYADIAVSSAVAINRLQQTADRSPQTFERALALNLILNASWCWVFFKGHRLLPAVAVAAALTAGSADLARRAGRADRRAGVALVPYAIWCGFATVLSAAIWRRNRRPPV